MISRCLNLTLREMIDSNLRKRSESLIINCLMTEPDSIHDIMSKVSADMFRESDLRKCFTLISNLYAKREQVNLISISKLKAVVVLVKLVQ